MKDAEREWRHRKVCCEMSTAARGARRRGSAAASAGATCERHGTAPCAAMAVLSRAAPVSVPSGVVRSEVRGSGLGSRHRGLNIQSLASNVRSPVRRKTVSPFDPTDLGASGLQLAGRNSPARGQPRRPGSRTAHRLRPGTLTPCARPPRPGSPGWLAPRRHLALVCFPHQAWISPDTALRVSGAAWVRVWRPRPQLSPTRTQFAACRTLLHQPAPEPREPETAREMVLRLTGIDITVCQQCGEGTLRQTLVLEPQHPARITAMKTGPP